MSKRRTAAAGLATAGLAVTALLAAGLSPVHADPAPQVSDVTGVGSDVVQTSIDFLADGFGSDLGFNAAGNRYRVFNYDATPDGNGRNTFTDPSLGTSVAENPSVALRAGQPAVTRPNGGSAGLSALYGDDAGLIDFVRSPNLPKAAGASGGPDSTVGQLDAVEVALDHQYILTSSGSAHPTHAPQVLTAVTLGKIYSGTYKTWGDIPGYGTSVASGGVGGNSAYASDAIYAERPQDGAGVLKIFSDGVANGGGVQLPGGTVTSGAVAWAGAPVISNGTLTTGGVTPVQQNDPTTITSLLTSGSAKDATGDPIGQDAIVPFPKSRLTVYQDGFYKTPGSTFTEGSAQTAVDVGDVALNTDASSYVNKIPFYIVFRDKDLTSTTPWQPGSTLNWVKALFYNPDYVKYLNGEIDTPVLPPFAFSAAGQKLLTDAGVTPTYAYSANGSSTVTPITGVPGAS